PLPPCRDRGNSAAALPPPAAGRRKGRYGARRYRSCAVLEEDGDGPDLVGTDARIGGREVAGNVQRLVERADIDHVEAEQLFLRLGKGTIDHDRLVAALAQRRRGG